MLAVEYVFQGCLISPSLSAAACHTSAETARTSFSALVRGKMFRALALSLPLHLPAALASKVNHVVAACEVR